MSLIIAIDSTFEETVRACETFRRTSVYPALAGLGHDVRRLVGPTATRPGLSSALLTPGVAMLTGSGHGLTDTFTGEDRIAVLQVGAYQPAEVRGKIVHLLACLSAADLGVDLVRKGCRAFFGYRVRFAFPLAAPALFLTCDAAIDRALCQGLTAALAHEHAFGEFTSRAMALQQAGQPHMAAFLLLLRNSLASPSIDPRWGDPHAAL